MATKLEILDAALDVLRSGGALTIDAVARQCGLTKAGVIHHFASKEALAVAIVDHVMDGWEAEFRRRVSDDADAAEKLRAYVDYALMGDLDPGDLAFLADPRLRDKLAAQWVSRLEPWLGTALDHPIARTVRLLADGAWFDRSLGLVDLSERDRAGILDVAHRLIDEGMSS